MFELVRFDQASTAIVLKDEPISAHHIGSARIFRIIEAILDQFEDDIVARQREDEHHHSGSAFRDRETVAGIFEVRNEVTVKLSLAVPRMTDRVVEIVQTFARHEQTQIAHEFVRTPGVHAEV